RCVALVKRVLGLVCDAPDSPLHGCAIEDVVASDGRLARSDDDSRGESYAEILQRHVLDSLTVDGDSAKPRGSTGVLVGSLAVSRLGRVGPQLIGASDGPIPASAFRRALAAGDGDPSAGRLRTPRIV